MLFVIVAFPDHTHFVVVFWMYIDLVDIPVSGFIVKLLPITQFGCFSFVDHLCYFCLVLLCFHACLFVDALWSPAG